MSLLLLLGGGGGSIIVEAETAIATADALIPAVSVGGSVAIAATVAEASASALVPTVSTGTPIVVGAVTATATAAAPLPTISLGVSTTIAAVEARAIGHGRRPTIINPVTSKTIVAVPAEATAKAMKPTILVPTIWEAMHSNFMLPNVRAYIAGIEVRVTDVHISNGIGFEVSNAICDFTIVESPDNELIGLVDFGKQSVQIEVGYGGSYTPIFTGVMIDQDRRYFPYTQDVGAVGYAHYLGIPLGVAFEWNDQPSGFIWQDLVAVAELPDTYLQDVEYDLDGNPFNSPYQFAQKQDIFLGPDQAPSQLIQQLDQLFFLTTHDMPDGQVRREKFTLDDTGITPSYSFMEGRITEGGTWPMRIIEISRLRDLEASQPRNQVKVLGLTPPPPENPEPTDDPEPRPVWIRRDTSVLFRSPPEVGSPTTGNDNLYNTWTIPSDLLELTIHVQSVCLEWMKYKNRLPDVVTLKIFGNPYITPNMWIEILAPSVDIIDWMNYRVIRYEHAIDASSFITTLTLDRHVGDEGTTFNGEPYVDDISFDIEESAGLYTVTCRITVVDPDGEDDFVMCHWSTFYNGVTKDALVKDDGDEFVVVYNQSEWDAGPSVKILLVDPDGQMNSLSGGEEFMVS